jgi:hypothetical protein
MSRDSARAEKLALAATFSAVCLAAPLLLASTALARTTGLSGVHGLPFKATLTAATHHPKANTKWYYTIRVVNLHGAPVRARMTVQIKDPLGTLHPVLYANTKKKLVNWPIDGRFHDYIIWPTSSAVGIALTLKATIKTGGRTAVLTYQVTPH